MNVTTSNTAVGLANALRQLATNAVTQGIPLDVVLGAFSAVTAGLAHDTANLLAQAAAKPQIAVPTAAEAVMMNGRPRIVHE